MNRTMQLLKTKLSFVLLLSLAACGFNAYPISEDKNLGAQFSKEIEANQAEYPILRNEQVRSYVQNMTNEILQSPHIQYRNQFQYRVEVINKDIVNAFVTPGGYIYVYSGLLRHIDNEAVLAAVLAHEVAHAERRHSTKRLTKAYGAATLAQLALGQQSDNVKLAANMFTGLALLKNSRSDEYEADEYAFKYLQSSRWYPGGIRLFFNSLESGGGNRFTELLSTHPLSDKRIKAVDNLIEKNNIPAPTEATLFSKQYAEFKKLVR